MPMRHNTTCCLSDSIVDCAPCTRCGALAGITSAKTYRILINFTCLSAERVLQPPRGSHVPDSILIRVLILVESSIRSCLQRCLRVTHETLLPHAIHFACKFYIYDHGSQALGVLRHAACRAEFIHREIPAGGTTPHVPKQDPEDNSIICFGDEDFARVF